MKKFVLTGMLVVVLVTLAVYARSSYTVAAAAAKASTPIPSQLVTITMADGLEIKGDFYAAPEGDKAPSALLLHQHFGSGFDWRDFAIPLAENGYNVVAVDMRGGGLTGGKENWRLAESDAAALMDWLRDQPSADPDRVAIVGASIGANLAIRECAFDDACHAVIALSPGFDYFGVDTKDAIEAMEDKAVFLVASQRDAQSADSTKALTTYTPSSVNVMIRIYASVSSHGTAMLGFPDLIPLMTQWLDNYNK